MTLNDITKDVAQKPFFEFVNILHDASALDSIHLRRGLPYIYPLYRFFSPEFLYAQLLNMFLVALTALCIFDIAKLLANSTVARCALLFFLCAPTRAIYQLTPNYDVSGLFYIAVFQWGLIRILVGYPFFRMKSLVYASIFVSITLLLAGLARTVHIHLALTILLAIIYVVLIQKKPLKSHFVMSCLVFIALFAIPYLFTNMGLKSVLSTSSTNQNSFLLMRFNASSYNPTGTYQPSYFRSFTPVIPPPSHPEYCHVLPASELFYNPQSMISMYLKKITSTWTLSGEAYRAPSIFSKRFFLLFLSWAVLHSFLFLVGIIRLRRLLPNNQLLGLLVFFPFAYGFLHIFSEASIRYTFLLYFNSSIIVGLAMESLFTMKESRSKPMFNQWLVLLLGYFVLYYSAPPIYNYFVK
ncbi:MAG: hypothetical protein PHX74_10010, partial [Candidatus Sumerlaeales bacterium]|nr:hypothetical protein [Candidatus Sumerlaeales bacterium]